MNILFYCGNEVWVKLLEQWNSYRNVFFGISLLFTS